MIEFGWTVYLFLVALLGVGIGPLVFNGFDSIRQADMEIDRKWAALLAEQNADIEDGCRRLGITRDELRNRSTT